MMEVWRAVASDCSGSHLFLQSFVMKVYMIFFAVKKTFFNGHNNPQSDRMGRQ